MLCPDISACIEDDMSRSPVRGWWPFSGRDILRLLLLDLDDLLPILYFDVYVDMFLPIAI